MVLSKTTMSIYLQWSAPVGKTEDNSKSYTIHYHFSNGGSAKKNISPTTSFNLTNLIAGKTYMIHITAKNMFFEGGPSNSIKVTTRVAGKFICSIKLNVMECNEREKYQNLKMINYWNIYDICIKQR